MELIKLFNGISNEDINEKCIIKNTFFVDKMVPLYFFKRKDKNEIVFIFHCTQNSTEEEIYLNQIISYNDTSIESHSLKNSGFNINNINKFTDEFVSSNFSDKHYFCDFDMVECKDKFAFQDNAYRLLDENDHYEKLDLFFAREIYIQYNIFMQDFLHYREIDDYKKFCKKMQFITIEHVRIDDVSYEQIASNYAIIHTQYTIGNGPKLYKFENKFGINLHENEKPQDIFKITINYSGFRLCYDRVNANLFLFGMIYNNINDCLYLIYCDKFNNKEKYTILRLFRDIYNKTNLIDKYNNIKILKGE